MYVEIAAEGHPLFQSMSTYNPSPSAVTGRVKAPPGGQSSINLGNSDIQSDQLPSRRHHVSERSHLHKGSNVFSDGNTSFPSSPRRANAQHQQTFSVFKCDSNVSSEINASHRKLLSSPSKIDIFGREEPPKDVPAKRIISQHDSFILRDNDYETPRFYNATGKSQKSQDLSHKSSGIFDNETSLPSEFSGRRRLTPSHQSETDIFGHGRNTYREPTDYKTSSSQCSPQTDKSISSHETCARGTGNTRSLGSLLNIDTHAQVPSPISSRSNSPRNNMSQIGTLMNSNSRNPIPQHLPRKVSRTYESSIVFN